jgi:regulator of sigma E protease
MDLIIGIIAFIFVLGLIIVIHEGGHFLFARRANILCREFAFGMGPFLYKKKKGETLYSIRAFPIGGFCAIAGEEVENDPLKDQKKVKLGIVDGIIKKIYFDDDGKTFPNIPEFNLVEYDIFDAGQTDNLYMIVSDGENTVNYKVDPQALFVTKKEEIQIAPYNRTLGSKSKRARALVMFGGPMMNFILALVVFFLAGLIGGFTNYNSSVLNDTSIEGLQEGDKIIHLTSGNLNVEVKTWNDIMEFMDTYQSDFPSNKIIVEYNRDGVNNFTEVKPLVVIHTIGLVSDQNSEKVIIGNIDPKSKAAIAGLSQSQEIIKVNDKIVTSWKTIYDEFINNESGKNVIFQVMDNDTTKNITVQPYSKEVMDTQKTLGGEQIPMADVILGVSPTLKTDLGKSIIYSGKQTINATSLIFDTIGLLATSDEVGVKNLSGFVGIFDMTSQVAKLGFVQILNWTGMLSVNVGLLNLLPIPALDGGRLVFLGYEAVTKKKPNQKVETALITVTMILLFGLMIYVTFNDILRLVGIR